MILKCGIYSTLQLSFLVYHIRGVEVFWEMESSRSRVGETSEGIILMNQFVRSETEGRQARIFLCDSDAGMILER
jgi:hypothetical protein